MTKHYIEWMFPAFFTETSTEEVISRTPPTIVPKRAFAYRFFDREEVELDGEILRGKSKNISGVTYLGGTLMSLAEVKRMPGDHKILISNMEGNQWSHVVRTRHGQFMQWKGEDEIQPVFHTKD